MTSDNTPSPDDAPTEPRRPGQAFTPEQIRSQMVEMQAAIKLFMQAAIAFGQQLTAEFAKMRLALERLAAEMRRRAADEKTPADGPSATEGAETPLPGTPVTLETIQDISAGSKDPDRKARGGYRITAVDGGDEVLSYPMTMNRGKMLLLGTENANELQRCIADHEHHWRNADPLPGATPCEWATVITRRDAIASTKDKTS